MSSAVGYPRAGGSPDNPSATEGETGKPGPSPVVADAPLRPRITGVYWWPVYHALAQAGPIEVCVCNAAHMRNVPGRQTDIKDCQWIAELHEHGLLRPSFIPGQQVAALRARTRYRKKLIAFAMVSGVTGWRALGALVGAQSGRALSHGVLKGPAARLKAGAAERGAAPWA